MVPMTTRLRRRMTMALAPALLLTLAIALPALGAKTTDKQPPKGPAIDVQLLSFNDYHGHLEKSTPGTIGTTPAGGVEYLSSHLKQLRQGHSRTLTVTAGDLIGGSPFLSGLFHDEPSVESLNTLGLDVSSVGNHEFDEGITELLRMQNGGCHPDDGCYFPDDPYTGADFPWLAANVVNHDTGKTVLPPYWVENFQGAKIGFIGMTLEGTPALVGQAGIEGWDFNDEADTANALVPILKAQGVNAIVVLLHEGLDTTGGYNECVGISGPVNEIQGRLDPAIDMMITGHTHQAYNCVMTDPAGNPRHVTSAASFGRIITETNFKFDRRTQDIDRASVTVTNHVVDQTSVQPDPAETAVINKYLPISSVIGNRPVGTITADINRGKTASGSEDRGIESNGGNMIADAQLWATQGNGAELALMNPGGVRADLLFKSSAKGEGDGVVTYAEAFDDQPFGNLMVTIPMTGQQIIDVLKQQCQPIGVSRPFLHLGVSTGFTYDLAKTIVNTPLPDQTTRRDCTAISVTNVMLNGVALDPALPYLVSVNNFLADGGDNFTAFRAIPKDQRIGGGDDLQVLIDYLGSEGPIAPPGTDRVNELP
jgi:5'-nucleotidase